MRWNATLIGETRNRKGFLLIPRCINKEWRWLEMAGWVQQLQGVPFDWPEWKDIRWKNDGEEFLCQ